MPRQSGQTGRLPLDHPDREAPLDRDLNRGDCEAPFDMMRIEMKKLMVAATVLAVSIPSMAAAVTGNEFLDRCSSDNEFIRGWCAGHVSGVQEGLFMGATTSGAKTIDEADKIVGYCSPENSNLEQARDISVNYIRSHPESRHLMSGMLILIALREAWPCK